MNMHDIEELVEKEIRNMKDIPVYEDIQEIERIYYTTKLQLKLKQLQLLDALVFHVSKN